MFKLIKANGSGIFIRKEVTENTLTLLSRILYAFVFSLQKLNKLVLFQLASSVSVNLIHKIFSLLLIDLHLASLKHLHDLVFGDTA